MMMACYLSTPFLIFPILKSASRVIFTNFLNAHPLTRPHPHAVRRKVITFLVQMNAIYLFVTWGHFDPKHFTTKIGNVCNNIALLELSQSIPKLPR